MTPSAKRKRFWKRAGDRVFIDYGTDPLGQHWWRCEQFDPGNMYGPFPSEGEAERHSEATVFGPQCKIEFGGQLDPSRLQEDRGDCQKGTGRTQRLADAR